MRDQGIAITAHDWVQDDLTAQRLVQVLPDWSPPSAQAYAVTTTRLLPAKVRAFLDCVGVFISPKLIYQPVGLQPEPIHLAKKKAGDAQSTTRFNHGGRDPVFSDRLQLSERQPCRCAPK